MGAVAFLGYCLLAGGPPVVLWCFFIASKSFLALLALASAFYWLLTLFIISLLFRAFVPIPEYAALYSLALSFAVILQEAARYGLFIMHRMIVQQLEIASRHLHLPKPTITDRRLMATAHGMGHAIAQTAFLYFSWIQLSAGRGTFYVDTCPAMSYFLAAGLLTLGFFFLHTFSMVIAFHGLEHKNIRLTAAVGALHLVAALSTVFNMLHSGCVPATTAVLLEGCIATAGAALICWTQPTEDEESRHMASSSGA